MHAPLSNNETKRLEALRRYAILDTPAEQAFDDFTLLAATLCQAPISTMTFVDDSRQWFKARLGVDVAETPREGGFCTLTIQGNAVTIVEDAALDERFAKHSLVTGASSALLRGRAFDRRRGQRAGFALRD